MLFTTCIGIVAIAREKPEALPIFGFRKHSKKFLYALTFAAFVGGAFQIWRTDNEHIREHKEDRTQIDTLTGSVNSLKETNQKQYENGQEQLRKQDENSQKQLRTLQDKFTELKVEVTTEELRKKLGTVQSQLAQYLAPKPKPKIAFSFYEPDSKIEDVETEQYVPADKDVVSIKVAAKNQTKLSAADVKVWIRLCAACKFHVEPPGALRAIGALDYDREFSTSEIPAETQVVFDGIQIDVPHSILQIPVAFKYRCPECEFEDWQKLAIVVGRMPLPQFSKPAQLPKKPRIK